MAGPPFGSKTRVYSGKDDGIGDGASDFDSGPAWTITDEDHSVSRADSSTGKRVPFTVCHLGEDIFAV